MMEGVRLWWPTLRRTENEMKALRSSEATYLGDLVAACVALDEAWDAMMEPADESEDVGIDAVAAAIGEMRTALHGYLETS